MYDSPTHPPPQILESKETKASTPECIESNQKLRISHVKNVNKTENRLTPIKLENKKQDKKMISLQEGPSRKFPSNDS